MLSVVLLIVTLLSVIKASITILALFGRILLSACGSAECHSAKCLSILARY